MKKVLLILTLLAVIITGVLLIVLTKKSDTTSPIATDSLATSAPVFSQPITAYGPPAPAGESKLSKTLRVEGQKLNQKSLNPQQDEENLESLAASLTAKDGHELSKISLDASRNKNERFLATYLLGKRAHDFVSELAAIAGSKNPILGSQPNPHTAALITKNFEVSNCIEALKGLDTVVKDKGQELASVFQNIQSQSPSITVRQIARIGYVGAVRNEPLVNKYIDSKLQAVLK